MIILSIVNQKLKPTQVIVLGFLAVILVGTFMLMLPIATKSGSATSFIDAFFTSTSAVCVTGLVVNDTGTYWSVFGKTVIMLLIQIGGLGFMTMAISAAIVLGKKIGLKNRIIMQEALNQFSISGVIRLTKYILISTVVIEIIGAILLSLRFIPQMGIKNGIFYSVFHSISAFCNAGFDIMGGGVSLMDYVSDPLINFTIMALIIVGGLGFAVLVDLISFLSIKRLTLHSKMVLLMTSILISIGFVLILLFEFNNEQTIGNMNFYQKIMAALFHSVTPRTAGFNTLSLTALNPSTRFLTIVLMFIGGSPGSTAGGIKTTTFAMVLLSIVSVIRGNEDIQFMNRRISKQIINRGLAVVFISSFIVVLVILFLTVVEPQFLFEEILFEAISAFGTVGLSLGITPYLSTLGKMLIIILMFFGRLGPLTIVLSIASSGIRKTLVRYPEGKIIVG